MIPAFVNPAGGSAQAALDALKRANGFAVHAVDPRELPDALRQAVAAGAPRVLVAGGDGTLSSAASVLAGTPVALAVLPAGTLNHFARDHGIPSDFDQALELAARGSVGTTDVGYVNDELFLNTSSVGAYIRFVRTRDRIERIFGYHIASVIAGLRVLATLRPMHVGLEVSGAKHEYSAPLLFVGVRERILTPPNLGAPAPDGVRALHVVIPRGRRQARRLAGAYARIERDLAVGTEEFGLDSALVHRFRLELRAPSTTVATDGELKRVTVPLEYRFGQDALNLVIPDPTPSRPAAP
jgi:diacylglycerol kinase family enzyme